MIGIIESLQWAASSNRPHLPFPLAMALSELNKSKSVKSIKTANQLIDKYYGQSDIKLKIRPMTGHLDLEVYGDSAFKYSQHQGVVAVLRNPNTDMVNVLSWRTRRAERRTWSTLAAETFVLQKAIDKAVYLEGLMKEMGAPISKVTAITNNLSLRRVVYSGRPTQEERMKKEIAVVRDVMVTEQIEIRYVPGHKMLADCNTKSANDEVLMDAVSKNNASQLKQFDSEKVTKQMTEIASREIPLEAVEAEQRKETHYLPDQQSLD